MLGLGVANVTFSFLLVRVVENIEKRLRMADLLCSILTPQEAFAEKA